MRTGTGVAKNPCRENILACPAKKISCFANKNSSPETIFPCLEKFFSSLENFFSSVGKIFSSVGIKFSGVGFFLKKHAVAFGRRAEAAGGSAVPATPFDGWWRMRGVTVGRHGVKM